MKYFLTNEGKIYIPSSIFIQLIISVFRNTSYILLYPNGY